jgi:S-adenosylmethionine:tRNA ribosyltransferase-isomerase
VYDRRDDFLYDYPPELIAQRPLARRDESRLMMVDRHTGNVRHQSFPDFLELPAPGDVVIVNSSRVIKARLRGVRDNGRPAEVLLVHPGPDRDTWVAMVHPGGKLKTGRTIQCGDWTLTVDEVMRGGMRTIHLAGPGPWHELVATHGTMPLPPYIAREADTTDDDRYQTVFADQDGSVAAPTAGLHFTRDLLQRLQSGGVGVHDVTLHVGPGTFKPVQTDLIANHTMHAEWYSVPASTADAINHSRNSGGRIWSVGPTVVRVLESVTGSDGTVRAGTGWTRIFIRAPWTFRATDALVTNFHLPGSTLLMLVCAFGGHESIMRAYRDAVAARYRLYSYGDAMVIS